jgi:hypothetical protein
MAKKWTCGTTCVLLLLSVVGCSSPGGSSTQPQWSLVGSAKFSAGAATEISLALDSTGIPCVAFADGGYGNKLTVMKHTGSGATGWSLVGSGGFSTGAASCISLASDSAGHLYVGYIDAGTNKATLMKFSGATWAKLGDAPAASGTANYASVALDPGSNPCLAFEDITAGYADMYWYNGSWHEYAGAAVSLGAATYTSLAFDSAGGPCVAFRDAGSKATVRRFINGTGWTPVGSAGFSGPNPVDISLAAANSGPLYVAYQDGGVAGSKASVMKFDGSSWTYAGSQGISSGQATRTSIKANAQGVPYIAFVDGGNGNKATVMYYTGSGSLGWSAVGSGTVSSGQADFTSLALDSSDTPYVAFQDGGAGVTVMVFK